MYSRARRHIEGADTRSTALFGTGVGVPTIKKVDRETEWVILNTTLSTARVRVRLSIPVDASKALFGMVKICEHLAISISGNCVSE